MAPSDETAWTQETLQSVSVTGYTSMPYRFMTHICFVHPKKGPYIAPPRRYLTSQQKYDVIARPDVLDKSLVPGTIVTVKAYKAVTKCRSPPYFITGSEFLMANVDLQPLKADCLELEDKLTYPVDISDNHKNNMNHAIHDCIWCPCVLYFMAFFCIPALFFMYRSDEQFKDSNFAKAARNARLSSVCFVMGLLSTLCFYSSLVWYVYRYIS